MMLSLSVVFKLHVIIVLFAAACSSSPKPNPKSVVQVGKARFTLLTSHLVRMEWGGTNDNATFAFINRNTPTPLYNTSKDGDWTVIQTANVKVSIFVSSLGIAPFS